MPEARVLLALQLTFALSALWLVYIYLLYPALLYFLTRRSRIRRLTEDAEAPEATIVIAAFNEEDVLEENLENKLSLDYPPAKLEIIVVSDDSTDATDQIVETVARDHPDRVRFIRQTPRQGKTAALNLAVEQARGEIIVFADANSIYEPLALRKLVANFADKTVGYVTGKMIYTNPDGSITGDGCTAYMRYENLLRELETKLGSVVGVDGGIDAVRRYLYQHMRADQLPDFVLPLRVVEQGYRVVYEPNAVLREPALESAQGEYRMRVRVALRALWAMYDLRRLFNPLRYPVFSWQLASHKLLRYMAFFPQALLLLTNSLLASRSGLFQLLMMGQIFFYVLVAAGYAAATTKLRLPFTIAPYYLTLLNLSCGHAFVKFLLGHKQVLWTPRAG